LIAGINENASNHFMNFCQKQTEKNSVKADGQVGFLLLQVVS